MNSHKVLRLNGNGVALSHAPAKFWDGGFLGILNTTTSEFFWDEVEFDSDILNWDPILHISFWGYTIQMGMRFGSRTKRVLGYLVVARINLLILYCNSFLNTLKTQGVVARWFTVSQQDSGQGTAIITVSWT